MSVVINGTGSISGLSNVGGIDLPQSGSVLQVVQATTTTGSSTTSTSFVTTGFSASITPKFSTSKIAVFVTGQLYTTGSGYQTFTTIYRNATELTGTGQGFAPNAYSSAGSLTVGAAFNYVDSPATTSSTTYTIYHRTASGTSWFNGANGVATIILMEIAA